MKNLGIATLVAATAVAAVADSPIVRLNDYAVKENGEIVVLGTEGAWGGGSATKEKVFDGDTNTFFDPPGGGETWAGIELETAMIPTKVRYYGRYGWRLRMLGCRIQGANESDFSDAVTLCIAYPKEGWNGASWLEVDLPNNSSAFKYLRIWSNGTDGNQSAFGVGNAGELEFYGYAQDAEADTPATPAFGGPCDIVNFHFSATVSRHSADETIQIQRREHGGEWSDLAIPDFDADSLSLTINDAVDYGVDYRYRLVLGPSASAWAEWTCANLHYAFKGDWIASNTGSYGNIGNTGLKAFDGDLYTFVDAPNANPYWTGLDFGQARTMKGIRFLPRPDQPGRMVNATFEIADSSDFSDATVLYTVTTTPAVGTLVDIALEQPVSGRYVRYRSDSNSWGNVNEVEFYGDPPAPDYTPTNIVAALPDGWQVATAFSWDNADCYYDRIAVYRSYSSEGPWTQVAELPRGSTSWTDDTAQYGPAYYYSLAYLTVDGNGDPDQEGEKSHPSLKCRKAHRLERDYPDNTSLKAGVSEIHEGGYWDGVHVAELLFDGDTGTFCDLQMNDGGVGVDLGESAFVTVCRVARRETGDADVVLRPNGAALFGATELPASGRWSFDVKLTDDFAITENGMHTFPVDGSAAYRYLYVGKPGQQLFGNFSELELYGYLASEAASVDEVYAPESVSITHSAGNLTIAWSDVSIAEGFDIERRVSGTAEWTTVAADLSASASPWADTTVVHGTLYEYRVVAKRGGDSVASAAVQRLYYDFGTGTGLRGKYSHPYTTGYGTIVSESVFRVDPTLDMDWGGGTVGPTAYGDNVYVEWRGQLEVPMSSDYTFTIESDDGVAFFIDGVQAVFNTWTGTCTATSDPIHLSAGRHDVLVCYNEYGGNAKILLKWSGPVETGFIPQSQLYPAEESAFLLPEPWCEARTYDLGRAGRCIFNQDGSITMAAAGGKFEHDNMLFLWRKVSGDFVASFRYERTADGIADSDVNMMLFARRCDVETDWIAYGSPFVAAVLNLNDSNHVYNGFNAKARTAQSAAVSDLNPSYLTVNSKSGWLYLSRIGNVFTIKAKEGDAANWTTVATYVDQEGVLGGKMLVGPAMAAPGVGTGVMTSFRVTDVQIGSPSGWIILIR